MHGGDRGAELDANRDGFGGGELRPALQELLERLTADELHPQSNLIADPLGAVNGHDIRVADPREQPAFLDDRRRPVVAGAGRREQLQRHFAIETRVPGAINRAEGAAPDPIEDAEMTPVLGYLRTGGIREDCRGPRQRPRRQRLAPMHRRKPLEHAQLTDDRPFVVAGARFGEAPVDGRAVEHLPREVAEQLSRRHAPSPRPDESAPVLRLFAPPRHWASPARPPTPGRCSPFRRAR